MNDDDFENRLQRQPLRTLPDEWKTSILNAAHESTIPERPVRNRSLWREVLWPHPVAWGGIAAVWCFIGLVSLLQRDNGFNGEMTHSAAMAPESMMLLVEQRQLRKELLEEGFSSPEPVADASPRVPADRSPRSSRRSRSVCA